MDRSNIIYLISQTKYQDDCGVWHTTQEKKRVFCQVESIAQREFFEAGRNGLNPSMKFVVFFADYSDESLIEFNGNVYSIYRTYLRKDDELELYCERKGGSNTTPSA